MKNFMIRIELHYAEKLDYEILHRAMEAKRFSRIIQGDSGVWYHLPTAEYCCTCDLPPERVRVLAKQAANTTGKSSMVIVSEVVSSYWYNLTPIE